MPEHGRAQCRRRCTWDTVFTNPMVKGTRKFVALKKQVNLSDTELFFKFFSLFMLEMCTLDKCVFFSLYRFLQHTDCLKYRYSRGRAFGCANTLGNDESQRFT